MSSASTGISCHPSLDPSAGTTNTPTGRSTLPDRPEPLAGEREPGVRADPPAAQVAGVELAGVGEQPPRQVVRQMVVEPERAGEHAPLIELIRPHARIVERRPAALAWARASRSSSVLAGVVTVLQSSPASRSAAAWPSIRAVIAAEVRRVALSFPLPWR